MAVGQSTTKQTWLLDNVELRGVVVANDGQPAGAVIGSFDDFNLQVDPNYRHIAMHYNTDRVSIGQIHCETYPLVASETNHNAPWSMPMKPTTQDFMVIDPTTGQSRQLRDGDHIRITGRWTIDKHPELNVTRNRGITRIGHVHMELHPFKWDGLSLDPILPRRTNHEVVSVAAPLFDEVYLSGDKWFGNWLAGVGSRVFIAEDLSDFHNTVTAEADILAPPFAGSGFTPAPDLIDWRENILVNGTGMNPSAIRTVSVLADRIRVVASVTAPGMINALPVGDINDPANGRSVFQAAYTVRWKPRLSILPAISILFLNETTVNGAARGVALLANRTRVAESAIAFHATQPDGLRMRPADDLTGKGCVFSAADVIPQPDPSILSAISIGSAEEGLFTEFAIDVQNIGPDPINILDICNISSEMGGQDPEFIITTAAPVVVPPKKRIEILGSFAPLSSGVRQTTLLLHTDDPGFGPLYQVTLRGLALTAGSAKTHSCALRAYSDAALQLAFSPELPIE